MYRGEGDTQGIALFLFLYSKYMKRYLMLFLLGLSFLVGAAQNTDNGEVSTRLDEVVITAQYAPVSEKNAIHKVKIIDRKTILRKAANNLREILEQELNMDLEQSSVFGSSIELQGISKENIKILVDGIPVIGRLDGIIDLSQINLSNVERIEIIEGPTSVFYGTDAMGGIINIITDKNQNKPLAGNLSLYYESVNVSDINAGIGVKKGRNTLIIDGGNYYFGGLDTQGNERSQNWEKKKQNHANLLYKRNFRRIELQCKSSYFHEKLQDLGERKGTTFKDKDYYTQRFNNSINLQGKISDKQFLLVNTSFSGYQRFHNTFEVDSASLEAQLDPHDNGADNRVRFRLGKIRAQVGQSVKEAKLNYAAGIDLDYESTEGARILDRKQAVQTYAGFGSVNYKLWKEFEIQPALRFTLNSVYGSLLSPAFNAKLEFSENSRLRFSYARGFRAPSLKELFLDFHIQRGPFTYNILGNKDLEVEKSHSFNLHYSQRWQLSGKGKVEIAPAVFYNRIENLITLSEMQNNERHYININHFESVGGKLTFACDHGKQWSAKAGLSLTGRYNKYSAEQQSKTFLYSPDASASFVYSFEKPQIDVLMSYKYTGKRPGYILDTETGNLVETVRKDYHDMDFSVSKTFLKGMISAVMGVKNIFDVTDIETLNQVGEAHARDMQLWGRSYFVKTQIRF